MAAKAERLDLRLTEDQRDVIERAADLSGSTLAGWAVSRLVSAARAELAAATTTRLSTETFDAFLDALESPPSPRMDELLARTPAWEQ